MKNRFYQLFVLPLLFVFLAGTANSQDCITKYIGSYSVNIDKTFSSAPETQAEEISENFMDMIKTMTFEITSDSITISRRGRARPMPVSSRTSEIEGGSCDMLLLIPAEQIPDGAQAPFITIYETKDGDLMFKMTNASKDMDYYVWQKTE